MKKTTRISYNWKSDVKYTLIWSVIIITVFLGFLELSSKIKRPIHEILIFFYGFTLPLITFVIGLRPILSLFTIPDTLFINKNGQLMTENLQIIAPENIKTFELNPIGFGPGYLIYYEMTFFNSLNISNSKKRNSLILTEPYRIKYIFQSRTDLVDRLIKIGLEEKKIISNQYKTRHFFGLRNKFGK